MLHKITANFNDVLFRETGIRTNSITTRNLPLNTESGNYTLRVVKQNSAGAETLYIGLYDAYGDPAPDLQAIYCGRSYGIDPSTSAEAIAIKLMSGADLRPQINLTSASRNLTIAMEVHLEQAIMAPNTSLADQSETNMEDPLIQAASSCWKNIRPVSTPCPEPELVFAYAYRELTGTAEAEIRNHIHRCKDCLDLVLDARIADSFAQTNKAELPAWLTNSTETLLNQLQTRFRQILVFPKAAFHNLNQDLALMMARFQEAVLPMHASDDDTSYITAKMVRIENDQIADIQPITVLIHRLEHTENRLRISGELPDHFRDPNQRTLCFGWQQPDETIIPLSIDFLDNRKNLFISNLSADKTLFPDGSLALLVYSA